MGKHRTSASLGNLNQYTSPASSEPMPEPENIYTKVESLERRVSTLEGLLNDVMHQIDKPVKNQSFGNGGLPSKAKPHKKAKPAHKPTPNEPPSKGKGNSPEQQVAKQEAAEKEAAKQERAEKEAAEKEAMEARARACEQLVLDFLADGKTVSFREFFQEMPDHEFSKKLTKRVLNHLSESGKVKRTRQEIEGETVAYFSIAKQ